MTAVPRGVEAAIAVGLALSVARAFFGRPPRRADPLAAAGWMLAGLMMLLAVAFADPRVVPREVLTALAVESICVAGWWLRVREADDPGPGSVAGADDGPPPIDWDAFDRERGGWRPPAPPRELV